jgi:hypothetical protein
MSSTPPDLRPSPHSCALLFFAPLGYTPTRGRSVLWKESLSSNRTYALTRIESFSIKMICCSTNASAFSRAVRLLLRAYAYAVRRSSIQRTHSSRHYGCVGYWKECLSPYLARTNKDQSKRLNVEASPVHAYHRGSLTQRLATKEGCLSWCCTLGTFEQTLLAAQS